MSEFWKKTLFWGAVGFVLGMLVSLGFLLPMGIAQYYARHGSGRLALQLLAGGALGAINMGSTSIYSLERWSLLRCTLTHFCIAMPTYFTGRRLHPVVVGHHGGRVLHHLADHVPAGQAGHPKDQRGAEALEGRAGHRVTPG